MCTVVFDTETSGLSPSHGHRIIEIGAVRVEGEHILSEFHCLINAGVPIDSRAKAVHGISQEMLCDQPRSEEALSNFHDFIGHSALVAHNASFDMRFLRAEFSQLGLVFANPLKCTLQLSRRYLDLPNYRLSTVYRYFGGKLDETVQRHRALGDARMAALVWRELQKIAKSA